jgi:hypothetical protein
LRYMYATSFNRGWIRAERRKRMVEPRYVDGPSFTERLNGDPSKALKRLV